jgi:hypothetical protein
MSLAVTSSKVVLLTFPLESTQQTIEGSFQELTRTRKLVPETAKSVSHSWQSRLEAVYYVIESFCNVYTEQNRTRVGVAQSENTGCGRFS